MTQTPDGYYGYARVPQRRDGPPPLAQRPPRPPSPAQRQPAAPPLAQRRPAGQRRDARYEGVDPSGTVRISLDELGRVCEVALGRNWHDQVGADGLGRAVVEAAGAAQQRSFEAWDHSSAEEARLERRRSGNGQHGALQPRHRQPEDRQMSSLAMDVTSRVEAASRGISDAALRTVEGESPGGRAIIALRAGQLIGAAFQMAWLATADRSTIAEHIQAAYDSAYTLAQTPGAEDDLPLDALRSADDDNTFELLRRYGLDPRS